MTLDLTDDEKAALVAHLSHSLEYAPFPYAPRLDPLKAILANLEPPVPQPETLPPLKPGVTPGRRVPTRRCNFACSLHVHPRYPRCWLSHRRDAGFAL